MVMTMFPEQDQRHPQDIEEEKERLELELIDSLDAVTEDNFDIGKLETLLAERRALGYPPELDAIDVEKKLAEFCQRYAPVFDRLETESHHSSKKEEALVEQAKACEAEE